MSSKKNIFLIAGLFVLALLALTYFWFSTALASDNSNDKEFLNMMIPHHAEGLFAANLCLQKATHTELKEMCRNMIDSQSQEIDAMNKWSQSWYKQNLLIDPMSILSDKAKNNLERLLNKSDEEFDKDFIQSMISHHNEGIEVANQCAQQAKHKDLVSLCKTMIQEQEQDNSQLSGWLESWYQS